jgi:hypothetical protein
MISPMLLLTIRNPDSVSSFQLDVVTLPVLSTEIGRDVGTVTLKIAAETSAITGTSADPVATSLSSASDATVVVQAKEAHIVIARAKDISLLPFILITSIQLA